MTTIAYDGNFIAADGLRTWGDQITGRSHKKLIVRNQIVYAFTGFAPLFGPMVEWHAAKSADPSTLPALNNPDDEGWTLIVIDKNGCGTYTAKVPYIERFDPPIAFGAGKDYAIGAMWAGATAEQAVRLVAENTNHTGGDIQVVSVASLQLRVAS